MALKALVCPNCGAAYDPSQYRCAYCGSYIILNKEDFCDFSKTKFEIKPVREDKYPGIYVFGRLLGKGERPILLGVANHNVDRVNAVGGKLLLTNQSLSFSAHVFNWGPKLQTIPLREVLDVKITLNALVSQKIDVRTAKKTYNFTVRHGKDWVEKILDARKHCNDHPAAPSAAASAAAGGDYTAELRRLKALLDEGIITQEEFNVKKRLLLGI